MNHDAAVAKERVYAGLGREVQVQVGGLKTGASWRSHGTMFAAQVADLATFWLGWVADWGFTALVRVEVSHGGRAVAI